jgi:hypothetical protein
MNLLALTRQYKRQGKHRQGHNAQTKHHRSHRHRPTLNPVS